MTSVAARHTAAPTFDAAELTRILQAELASPSCRPPLLPAVAMEVMELAQTPEWFTERLNRHATATAHVARLLCKRRGLPGEHAFMCGLLHDIGFSAALLIVAEREGSRSVPFPALAPVLDAVHTDASGLLAWLWKLPTPLADVLGSHHDGVVDGQARPLNAALILAEQLCWEAGAGVLAPPRDADSDALESPDQPLDGIDANWATSVEKAEEIVGLEARAVRADAFALVEELGLGERIA